MNTYQQLKRTLKFPLKGIFTIWNSYWFYPAPLLNLAVCRILVVGFQLYYLLSNKYGNRILTEADIPGRVFNALPVFQALNLPFPWEAPPNGFLSAVFVVMIVSGISSLFGLKTRLSLFVFALTNLYIQTYLYSFGRVHHTETLSLIALFLLAFAPSGGALSFDDLGWQLRRNTRKQSVQTVDDMQRTSLFARWPLLATQWLFSLVYLSAGINKVNADGPGLFTADWMNGYTLQYYLMQDGLRWGSDLGVWLAQSHVFAVLSSWFAVLFEVTFWLVLPFPKLIWLHIPLGFFLHIGIWMAQRAPFFQYLALYAVFIPWRAVFKVVSHWFCWPKQNWPKMLLLYSSQQGLPIRLATLIAYFDWFNRIEYLDLEDSNYPIPEQPLRNSEGVLFKALYWVEPSGKFTSGKFTSGKFKCGFEALRESMGYCPMLWPLKWICSISTMRVLFKRTYHLTLAKL